MPGLHEMPDSAYGLQDPYPSNDQGVHHMDPAFDPTPFERWDEANDEALDKDETSEYNWGPPPPDHDHEPPEPHEVDTHYDPDHGREDHRVGAVLRQSEQWGLHLVARGLTEDELNAHGHAQQHHDGIQYLKDTGLYGEDEDHPYKGVIGRPSPDGKGYDVIRTIE